jgi:hypothetical protein
MYARGQVKWTSHLPHEQKTRVRIRPGYKVFKENIAMLLCLTYVLFVRWKTEVKALSPKNVLKTPSVQVVFPWTEP